MKQLNLLKTLFLLCALMVGSLNSWADVSTLEFTSACGGSGTADDGKEWTVTSDANESTYDNDRGIHYGTGKKAVSYIQLTSSSFTSGTITKIVVNASGNSSPSLSVTVGGAAFGTTQTGITTSNAAYTFTGSAAAGNIVIRLAKANSATGALYVKSVAVTYSSGPSVPVTGVALDQTSLSLTAGDKATLTPTVSPAEASNKNVSWESDDEGVATVAGGVVTAVAAGTCTITVTTVDEGFTATCDVTVNAAPEPALTFDFGTNIFSLPVGSANKTVTAEDYTDGDYTINVEGSTGEGYYWHTDGYLLMGKSGAKLTFPAFDFNVSKIKIYGRSGASSNVTFNIFVSDVAVSEEATSSVEDHQFKIPADKQAAGTVYVLKVTNGNNCQITKVEFLGYIETPAVTAAGYATYVAPKNLEFAEGDAYRVKVDAGVAKLYPVTQVLANTPVLLKGEGTKKPAVLETNPSAIDNDLKVSNGGDPADAYVLANKTKGVGFYKWNGGSLAAGKVYLYAPGLSAHEYIAFDGEESGEVTGINEVAADKTFNGEFFNLAGQRVAQPTKGLYIVNGKKVIIK